MEAESTATGGGPVPDEQWRVLPVVSFDLGSPWLVDEPVTERGPEWFSATIHNPEVPSARIEWRHGYVTEPLVVEQLQRAREGFDIDADTLEFHDMTDELGLDPATEGSGTQFFTAGGEVVVAQTIMDLQVGGTLEVLATLVAGFDDFEKLTEDYFAMLGSIELAEGLVPPINEILIASTSEQ
ncbi:MAG: hypothetical protein QM774_06710 [Gordonia sp. (in: high G+C Gram-positive bacteria)]|uniref:hypothetical protein n=1 Tax=Gordonia sp. (in: high G+C Gram-positive bacteria) TaxID=84139 RepID=UPI0039E25589